MGDGGKGLLCRSKLVASVKDVWTRAWDLPLASHESVGLVLSGGVDTCAVMEALNELGLKPSVGITVYADEKATDRPYARAIAAKYALEHVEIDVAPEDLLGEPLEFAVKVLGTFDGMELRNSIVVARALMEAKKRGIEYVLTGDGSDELLGGYSFTHGSEDPLWTQKRNEMCANWFFSAPVMGKSLGLNVESPYCNSVFKDWALTLGKADCIAEREQESFPGEEKQLRTAGKVPLREAYPDALSAWRRKDPIEVGSGSTILGADNGKYFESKIKPDEFLREKQRVAKQYSIALRNPEHVYYFRVFEKLFPLALEQNHDGKYPVLPPRIVSKKESSLPPIVSPSSTQKQELTRKAPTSARLYEDACIGCQFKLPLPTSNFCKVCGAWPARRQSTSTALLG